MVVGSAVATIAGRQSHVPAGTRLGRYRVVRRLASGGMCEVYLARAEGEAGFAKPVALKLVLPHLVEEANFTTLLRHEAKLAAYLNHPNIVQTFELGREGDELYIAMEYVHGRTLREVLAEADGPLPLDVALSILVATCTALHTAHCATGESGSVLGVVHRDVSPANVMLRHDGVVKVVDFGIAKAMTETTMTKTGTLKGKSGYMSPEQCRGDELTAASDIFNLGILLYETTTGRRAFVGANIFETMNRIVDSRYKPPRSHLPEYPLELASIVDEVLADDPSQRPASALALRQRLEAFAMSAGLHLSELVVQQWLEHKFGPVAAVDLRLDPSVVAMTATPRSSSRAFNWAGAAIIGALTGSIAFVALGARSDAVGGDAGATTDTNTDTNAAAASQPSAPGTTEPTPKPEVPVADPIPTMTPKPAPDPAPERTSAEPPVVGAKTKSGKPKTRTKARTKKSRPKPKAKTKADEPLFPWKSN